MTLISAAIGSDGGIIVPDRKITFRFKPPEYRNKKVQSKYYPIVVGFAGSVELSQMFVKEAYELAQQQSYENHLLPKPPRTWTRSCSSGAVQFDLVKFPEYHIKYEKYIYDCGQAVTRINNTYSAEVGSKFDVVMVTQLLPLFISSSK